MDVEALGPELRAIVDRVVAARPVCADLVGVRAVRGATALVIRSPTGETARDVVLWNDAGDLGVQVYGWHTHGSLARWTRDAGDEVSSLVAIVLAVVDGEIVDAVHIGGPGDGSGGMLDLVEPGALADELTSPWSAGRIRVRTWSGRGDRELSLDELG